MMSAMVTVEFKPTVERYKKQILHEPVSVVIIAVDIFFDLFMMWHTISVFNIWRNTGKGFIRLLIRIALLIWLIWTTRNLLRSPVTICKQHLDISPDITYTLSFDDDIIVAEAHGSNIQSRDEYLYSRVSNAVFDKGWFIIRMDENDYKNQFVFSSDEVTGGNEMKLKALLSSKLEKKFRMKG